MSSPKAHRKFSWELGITGPVPRPLAASTLPDLIHHLDEVQGRVDLAQILRSLGNVNHDGDLHIGLAISSDIDGHWRSPNKSRGRGKGASKCVTSEPFCCLK